MLARRDPEAVDGVVVDLVKDRVRLALKGTGRGWSVIRFLIFSVCCVMAVLSRTGLDVPVRVPFIPALFRVQSQTWVFFAIVALISQAASLWKRRNAEAPRQVRLANAVNGLVVGLFVLSMQFTFYGFLLIELVPAFVFVAAGTLAIVWSAHPIGLISLRCTKCKYQFIPGDWAPDLCPECGSFWIGPRGLVRRRDYKRSKPVLLSGLCVLLMGVLALIAVPKLHSKVPTQWLLPKARGSALGMSNSEWARLDAAEIDEKQRRQLAETLLTRRRRSYFLSREADAWFQSAITASLLPDDLVERYHDEMLDLSLTLPDTVRAGSPFQVSIESSPHTPLGSGRTVYVLFGGYRIDDGPIIGRVEDPIYGISFGYVTRRFSRAERGDGPQPATLVIDSPGTHTISAEYRIIGVANLHAEPVIRFGSDGTLQRDPQWHYLKKLEISETIYVTPN
ncbi:MAG: hypothetical protein IID31_02675 [Planctomycetes bacterium]|nr:hypothetical protein [Planctomycetota bacterium]